MRKVMRFGFLRSFWIEFRGTPPVYLIQVLTFGSSKNAKARAIDELSVARGSLREE